MSWNSIVGQTRAKMLLKGAVQRDRLAHAYLFTGEEGVGADAAAIELAKLVNCDRKGDEACDACANCRAAIEGRNPNIELIVPLPVGKGEKSGDDPLAKLSEDELGQVREELARKFANPYHRIEIPRATAIKINSVRRIRAESSRSLFGAGKRVFVILGADMLNDEAGNALLKILEEPNRDTMLLLTTAHPDQLLPTIRSRCQHVQFEPVSEEEIALALKERNGIVSADAALLAGLSGGSYGKAVDLNGPGITERRNDAVAFLRVALYKPSRELLDEIDRLQSAYDRAGMTELLTLLESWLRDARLVDEGAGGMQSGLDRETVEKFAAHHKRVRYDAAFETLRKAISLLGKNVYIPLVLITVALELRAHILVPAEGPGRASGSPAPN